jgi:hypothetical protein
MFKKMINLPSTFYSLILTCLILPTSFLFAQTSTTAIPPPNAGAPVGATTLVNPLRIGSIEDLLVAILNILIIIAIPIVVFFIIYSGFLYVTARGNAQQVEQATRSLTYSVIGGVLIIGAVAIAGIVENLVRSF